MAYSAPGPAPSSSAVPPQLPAGNIYSAQSLMNPTAAGPVPIISKPISTTRILLLSGFAPELKTRDLLAVFAEWEDMNGGFRIKWIDDHSAYIVFTDPLVAKKAFLATVSNMPPSLTSTIENPSLIPAKLLPYTGPETDQILSSIAGRPRSGSRAGLGGSSSVGIPTNAAPGQGAINASGQAIGHGRRSSSSANGVVGMMGHGRRASHGGASNKGFQNGIPPSSVPRHSPSNSFAARTDGAPAISEPSPPRTATHLAPAAEESASRSNSPASVLVASSGGLTPEIDEQAVEDD